MKRRLFTPFALAFTMLMLLVQIGNVAAQEQLPVNLYIEPAGSGTVTGEGMYTIGNQVTIKANAKEGWVFENWTDYYGEVMSDTAVYQFRMEEMINWTANFFEGEYSLSTSVSAQERGSISVDPEAESYSMGDAVTFIATASEGYQFYKWEGVNVRIQDERADSITITMPGKDIEIKATFIIKDGTPGRGVTDADGNFYRTVIINEVEWMAENLRTTVYNDSSEIPTPTLVEWSTTTQGMYSIYPHDDVDWIDSQEEMVDAYGLLYNFYAVNNQRGLCPTGWRVADQNEFINLRDHVKWNGGYKINDTISDYWANANDRATNETGFSARPAGMRRADGDYRNVGETSYWWTPARTRWFLADSYTSQGVTTNDVIYDFGGQLDHNNGFSVRCVKRVYNLTIETDSVGMLAINGAGRYSYGDTITLEAIPVEGYQVVSWVDADTVVVSVQASFDFVMPNGQTTLSVSFELGEYELSVGVTTEDGGTVSYDPVKETYNFNDSITITATPEDGFEFVNFVDANGDVISDQAEFVYLMPAADATVNAVFNEIVEPDPDTDPDTDPGTDPDGTVSVASQEQTALSVYPNPVRSVLNITSQSNINRLMIIDVTGRVVLNENVNTASMQLSVDKFESGLYIVRIYAEDGMHTSRILIQK